jgi:hypothetical protein
LDNVVADGHGTVHHRSYVEHVFSLAHYSGRNRRMQTPITGSFGKDIARQVFAQYMIIEDEKLVILAKRFISLEKRRIFKGIVIRNKYCCRITSVNLTVNAVRLKL